MIESKDYYVDQINSSKANKMTESYHYSGVGFKKAKLNLGIYRKTDNLLVGVLQWGCSAQEGIRLDRYVKEPIKKEEYLELNRFSMADSEGKNAESQAISIGIKWIKQNWPHIRLLVSYAGRKEGNYGYIYQATNWEYLGYFISDGFWLLDGQERHSLTVWYYYKTRANQNLSFKEGICSLFHDVRQTWTKQFIYIQRLDKKLTCASQILPYPKPANEFPICTKIEIYQQNEEYANILPPRKEMVKYYYEKEKKLFTTEALKRRNEYEPEIFVYAMYDNSGTLESVSNSVQSFTSNEILAAGIHNAVKTEKVYKNKFFRKFNIKQEVPEHLDIKYTCILDGIYFIKQTDVARYLNISRQAVSQAAKLKAKTLGGKMVEWYEG